MEIKGIQNLSLTDWPGKISSIIFLNRCNLRCRYCHNPSLALGMAGQNYPPAYVLSWLKGQKDFIDGVVISGGEPTLHRPLVEFCRDIRSYLELDIKLDTNGTNPNFLKILLEDQLIDKVSLDIKAPLDNDEIYKQICGAQIDVKKIEESINLIYDYGVDCEFRTTVIPNLLSEQDIIDIACELSCICGGQVKEYTIQNFNPLNPLLDETLRSEKPYDKEILEKIRHKIMKEYGILKCTIK